MCEFWGSNPKQDPLNDFFNFYFKSHKLVDVEPIKLVMTRRNFIKEREAISKRIERFFMLEFFFANNYFMKSWVEIGGQSDQNFLTPKCQR